MWAFVICAFAIWPRNIARAETEILYTNGWVPISSETIYNQINRDHVNTKLPSIMASHNIQVVYTDINKVSTSDDVNIHDEIADTEGGIESAADYTICKDCIRESAEAFELKNNAFEPNAFQPPINPNTTPSTARRSKHMLNHQIKNYTENMLDNNDTTKKKSSDKDEIRHYEVTEVDNFDEPAKSGTQNTGYEYEPRKNGLTRELDNILLKYKIKDHDELSNYALSRRPRAQILSNTVSSPTIFPNRVPQKYNNPNHLPTDPLLAVFLSNYGFYLQGLYGIHNNYNNLYGYLASNNIHNNRPFGFYKIFSDTDSSH